MRNINSIFIDANIFTYFLTNHPKYGGSCTRFLEEVENGKRVGFISPLIIDEVSYVLMIQKGRELTGIWEINTVKQSMLKIWEKCLEPVAKFYKYVDYLTSLSNLKVVSIDYSISRISLEYSRKYHLFPRDALHTACCKAYEITNIATNDKDFERIEWIKIWKL